MHLNRTFIKNEILCEYLPPIRKTKKNKVIIYCGGAPSVPSKNKEYALSWAKKGYWYFNIRYRGTWESYGEFLKKSPHIDVQDVIDQLSKGFIDAYTQKRVSFEPDFIALIGVSFGGAAVLLNAREQKVDKVVAISPVIDWTCASEDEPLDWLYQFIKRGFGRAYNVQKSNWKKLSTGIFFNPITQTDGVDGGKVFIVHAEDDTTCAIDPVRKYILLTGAKHKFYKRGGHGLKYQEDPLDRHIKKFITS